MATPLWGGTGNQATDVARPPDDPNDPNDVAPYQVTPTTAVPCWRVRQFIRGVRPLPGRNPYKYFAERPPHEQPADIDEWVKAEERYVD
jgi:hypothetical protein